MSAASMVQVSMIDRIPVVWTPGDGRRLSVSLAFRVGFADEPLVQRGVSHLIEHLALAGIADRLNPHNGFTGPTITSFVSQGDAGEVVAFVNDVVRSLAQLPFDRLDREASVLKAEAAQRRSTLTGTLLNMMCGNSGFGLLDAQEWALDRAVPSLVDSWRSTWFTAENAVLYVSGTPPQGFDFSPLPSGVRRPPPRIELIEPVRTWMSHRAGGVVMVAAVVPRHPLTGAGCFVLQKRLQDRLRTEEGRAYSVTVQSSDWTSGDELVFAVADCVVEHADDVRQAIQVELARLGFEGATPDEMRELVARMERAGAEEGAPAAFAAHNQERVLLGLPIRQWAEHVEQMKAIAPGDVARFAQFMSLRAMWAVPAGVGFPDHRCTPVRLASDQTVAGDVHRSTAPAGTWQDDDVITVGPDGLTWFDGNSGRSTVLFKDIVMLLRYSNGGRWVVGRDGFGITVHPDDWVRSQHIIAALDSHVPPQCVIDLDEPMRQGEPQPRPVEAAPAGGGVLSRLRRRGG
jgi:zinc protease